MAKDTYDFQVIPMDWCPRCRDGTYGLANAMAKDEDGAMLFRYVCPKCRLLWDCWWKLPADALPSYQCFKDRMIIAGEGLESHPQGEVDMPIGPSDWIAEHQEPVTTQPSREAESGGA